MDVHLKPSRTPPASDEDPLKAYLRSLVREVLAEEMRAVESWRWLTLGQASEIIGIKAEAVSARLRAGRLEGRLYGRRWYVDGEALARDIERSEEWRRR